LEDSFTDAGNPAQMIVRSFDNNKFVCISLAVLPADVVVAFQRFVSLFYRSAPESHLLCNRGGGKEMTTLSCLLN